MLTLHDIAHDESAGELERAVYRYLNDASRKKRKLSDLRDELRAHAERYGAARQAREDEADRLSQEAQAAAMRGEQDAPELVAFEITP